MAKRRRSGTGTVRLRKDGRWEARVVVGYDERGFPKTKNVLAKSKNECVEKLEVLKAEIGASAKTKCTSDMPFGEWVDYWYQTYCKNTLKEYTQITYEERIYKQIIPKIGDTPLNQVTAGTLEKFYAHLKADGRLIRRETYGPGLANSVIRSIHAHCRAALEKAKSEGLIRQNPAVNCKLPPKKSPEIEILSPEEMQRLLIQAKEDGFYEMFLLDLSTGLRRGELLGLQWKDIDFEKGTLSVNKQVKYIKRELRIMPPKTQAANRTLVLPPQLLAVLKEYREKVNSIWLFPSPRKDEDVPRDPTACRKALAKILERADCKHVPFHALRHTFASHAFHYGMDVKTLASTIGHESVETTLNVYVHSSDEMKRAAARKIDQTLGAVVGGKTALVTTRTENGQSEHTQPKKPPRAKFEPHKPKIRRPGTGSVHQVSQNSWQGRYSPVVDGKRVARNVYAPTQEECEEKLAELIKDMKMEFGIR